MNNASRFLVFVLVLVNITCFFIVEQGVPYPWFGRSATGLDIVQGIQRALQRGVPFLHDEIVLSYLVCGPIITTVLLLVLLVLCTSRRSEALLGTSILVIGTVASCICLYTIMLKDTGIQEGVFVQLLINLLFCIFGVVILVFANARVNHSEN